MNHVLGWVHRGPVAGWPERLVHFRRATVDLIRRRWALLTAAAIVGNLAVFLVLLVSLRAVGVGSTEVTWIEAFAGWSLARAPADPADPGRRRASRARPDGDPRRLRRPERGSRRRRAPVSRVHDPADTAPRARHDGRLAVAGARSLRGRSRRDHGESARRVKEQSHKDEMSARSAATQAAPRAWCRQRSSRTRRRCRSRKCPQPRPNLRSRTTGTPIRPPASQRPTASSEPADGEAHARRAVSRLAGRWINRLWGRLGTVTRRWSAAPSRATDLGDIDPALHSVLGVSLVSSAAAIGALEPWRSGRLTQL